MGQEHDGSAGQGRIGEVLLPGGCQPFGELRNSERYVGMMGCLLFTMELLTISQLWIYCGKYADRLLSAERYLELLKESKIRGYLFAQQNYVPKE